LAFPLVELIPDGSLAARLRDCCAADWEAFIGHDFVRQLGDGSLPEACFRYYLAQDYIFLMHFARAYALAAFKSDHLDDMRQAAATLDALINTEMSLHIGYCAGWGMSEAGLLAQPEDPANMAYTRFVLERGLAGDLLDLLVALAPCVIGYGVVGQRLASDPATKLDGNPYRAWIETYAGDDYLQVAAGAVTQLDRVVARRIGAEPESSGRWPSLVGAFRMATRLEARFWEMGLAPARD
jgi:thiaminase/transcriptional activator TenA